MKKPKMMIVMRTDLNMTAGKMVAQGGHAVAELMLGNRNELFVSWLGSGMKKVCVEVKSEEALIQAAAKAKELGFPVSLIQDAGLTQNEPGTFTCCAIGPVTEQQSKKVTGSLRLL